MKRILALLLMAAALCVSPFGAAVQAKDSSSTIEDVVKRGTLRVGFSSFVPWAMQDKEGKYIGFEIDVATRLARDLGVKLQLVPTNWDGIIPALLSGKFDVIIGSAVGQLHRALRHSLYRRHPEQGQGGRHQESGRT